MKDKDIEKSYWQDVEQKVLDPETIRAEFGEGELNWDVAKKSRRDFLKIMGFSFAASPFASSCLRIPAKKALPYLNRSDRVTMGVPEWYATTSDPLYGGHLLVKTREGRPIKIEGNALSPVTFGGTSAYDQASLLGLYDSHRYRGPSVKGADVSWEQIDAEVAQKWQASIASGKNLYVVTPPVTSPSSIKVLAQLEKKYSQLKHVVYWPDFVSNVDDLNAQLYGEGAQTNYSLEKVRVVLGLNADFLGTWPYSIKLTKQWSKRRDLKNTQDLISHLQVESVMSLTGSNADHRFSMPQAEEEATMSALLSTLQNALGLVSAQGAPTVSVPVRDIAKRLLAAKGQALILTGSTNPRVQLMAQLANDLLGAYSAGHATIYRNSHYRGYSSEKFQAFINDAGKGQVGAVIFWDSNLFYQMSPRESARLKNDLSSVDLLVHLTDAPNETTVLTNAYVMPTHHAFESWNDHFTAPNVMSWAQPLLRPMFNTRMAQDSLLRLTGEGDYEQVLHQSAKELGFADWNKALHDGVAETSQSSSGSSFNASAVSSLLGKLPGSQSSGMQMVAYQKVGMRLGKMSNNPWLQEMPDPITKATWENYFLIGPAHAASLGVKTGDILNVVMGDVAFELPAVVQPGMGKDTLAVAFGYGRTQAGKVANGIGANAFEITSMNNGHWNAVASITNITKTGANKVMAQTQTHHSMEGRPLVKETTLEEYVRNPASGNEDKPHVITLWSEHKKEGEQWALMIDLSKCTGCSSCIVSCNSENNVPVVGRQEVVNRREMHWIRLDRYYSGDEENPEVVHQPVMCQHCNNAPCETVCPVVATAGSSDGLNQQVYNRCVGTRYCANNCPFKVRRFNWFDYPHDDDVQRMVLNPDVVVRSRGVMEKCSMCIQRIQGGRLQAKIEGRELHDGDIKLACEQSCPADALVFGDMNDSGSRVAKMLQDERGYRMLEEINLQARVNYLTKVRNKA